VKTRSLAATALALGLAAVMVPVLAGADHYGPVLKFPRWVPLGPVLIHDGQAGSGRAPVTGRVTVIAPNPENPLGDIWIGAATGGVWHGSVVPASGWTPMKDDAPSLAVGALALDACTITRCKTVWVGTGENAIRRDTQYGKGLLKGTWNATSNSYDWTVLGADAFSRGSITRILLDPTTPDGPGKTLYVALSSGQTSNATHSTVTTAPAGAYGIWKSVDGGLSFTNVLDLGSPATDLEMDPQNPQVLFAGVRDQGIYRSLDGGVSWQPIHNGISAQFIGSGADWPEIAVHRTPAMAEPLLYAVLGPCPHPHEKGDNFFCSPAVYKSANSGTSWTLVHAYELLPPNYGSPLTSYVSYTHALTIHPQDPSILWYGGIGLYRSTNGGKDWTHVGHLSLHPDHHQIVVFPSNQTSTGVMAYDANDGGFYVGDGEEVWDGNLQLGLAVTQLQSVAASPLVDHIIAGAQDNGTNVFQGTDVWEHVDDGDASSTLMDLDNGDILYDASVGVDPERCTSPGFCKFGWPNIHDNLPSLTSPDVSWYPPLVQDPSDQGGQHPLYFATNQLFRSVADGDQWVQITPGAPLGGTAPMTELNGAQNPITAVAVAPSNPARIYLGFYDGQVFTTGNGKAASPSWTKIDAAPLPDRPVTSIAVHPTDEQHALVAFTGFANHSVYATTQAGASWTPLDGSADGVFAQEPVNALLIEPEAPHRVWAGTDAGVWSRSDPHPGSALWGKSKGLPNVAVYDLDVSGDGQSLLAATHGRGVWQLAFRIYSDFYYDVCCGPTDFYDPAAFIPVTAYGFDPGESCSMTLLEGARECATSAVDADGAALETDEHGFLVTTKAGVYTRRPLGWACYDGSCAGGVSLDRCGVSEIRITCGQYSVQSVVKKPREREDPPSTQLAFLPSGQEGSFTVAALLKKNGGDSRVLCEQTVPYSAKETAEEVLARAVKALDDDEKCRDAGVRPTLAGTSRSGGHEDEGPEPFRLLLVAPRQTGVQLVTEVTSDGPGAFSVGSFGVPSTGSHVVPRISLTGRAGGGRVEVTEVSPLGSCTFAVDTEAGDAAETVADRLQSAFLARETAPVLRLGAGCPARQNPRDAERFGATLRFPLGRQVTVTSTDRGLAFTLGSDR